MKSNAIAAFLTMLLVVTYPLVGRIQTGGFKDMSRIIPENALIYFEQRQGAKVLKDFFKSPLGKKIKTINFVKTGQNIGLGVPVCTAIEKLLAFCASAQDSKLFHEVFGKRFAVAILPQIDTKQYTEITDYIEDNAVIVAKPQHNAGGLALLNERYGKYLQMYSLSRTQYGNHHIRRIQMHDEIFSMVVIEGFFVMSHNEKQLRRCIDTFDAESPALSKKEDFLKIRKKFKNPDRFFYLPVKAVRKFIEDAAAEHAFPGKDLLLKELKTTVGFANVGYGSWNKQKSITDKILVQYNSKEVNSVVKKHIKAAPVQCSMLSYTTENPMAFYWSNTIKLKNISPYFKRIREEEPKLEKFWSTVENISGKNSQELFELFGKEMSIVLESGPKDNFFSVPLGMIFLKVENIPDLRIILEKIIAAYDIKMSEKSYGPVRYSFWTPSPQDGLQPLYGFWGDLLFLGNSTSLLKMVVDKKNEDYSLLDNSSIAMIDPGLKKKNNSVTYFNNVKLIDVLQRGLDLGAMLIAVEDRETASKVRLLVDEIINPLLDGAKMYDKSCSRSYFTPEMVVIESMTNKTHTPIDKRIH